ncbi:hypothetical protein D3C81_1885440 [compost metagenome]
MAKSFLLNLLRSSCPHARANTCMSSTDASKKFLNCLADFSISSFARSSFFCVAMPAGQLFVLHILAPTQPMACMALFARAIPSAPRARALTKSVGTRKPPVMISVTRPLAPCSSKYFRARASAGMVGTEM